MQAQNRLPGIHHLTAVTSSAAGNVQFYEKTMGLRLVKQTVNFDDPYTYHLYYGDGQGSPGTILTFSPWENLAPGRPGAGMVTAINFAIPRKSVDYWGQRLQKHQIPFEQVERFGDPVLVFSDPHGLPLELTGSQTLPPSAFWDQSPIDEQNAIAGFHSTTVTTKTLAPSKQFLTELMGMKLDDHVSNRYRFKLNDSKPGYYDVVVDPNATTGRPGAGTVHHIAFRTPDDASQARWQTQLKEADFSVTNVRNRKYFRSIYFNAPEGVLFEIATDPPGFTVDEAADDLGTSLKLPDQYETMRKTIESRLPPLRTG